METAKDLEQAIQRYEGYIKADAQNPLLWLNLGDLYHKAARFDQAIACYERCLLHQPGHAPARSRLASVMISLHRFDQAEKFLKELLKNGESDPALSHNLGLALFYQDRWPEARQCFADALAHGLKTAANFAYLSRSLHHMGMAAEALEACRSWAELAGDQDSKAYLALLEMDNGNMALARELALAVLAESPDHVDANVVAGSSSVERQEMRQARDQFLTVLRQQANHGRAWLGLGLVHLYEQEYPQAIEALEKAVRLMPDNPGTIVALAWARLAAKDAAGAEQTFHHAIRVERNFAESHGGLAAALALQNKVDQAKEEIRIATRLDPANFGGVFAKTILLKLEGKDRVATELLAKLLQQAPADGAPALIDHILTYMNKKPPQTPARK